MNLEEKFVSGKNVFRGRLLDVYCDNITLPNGKPSTREYIKHNGAVCVAPLVDGDKLIFVKQYRYPIGRVTLELPAGKLEKGEDPKAAALRELTEETGADVTESLLRDMGTMLPSAAYTDEVLYLYFAPVENIGSSQPDDDEFLDIEIISVKDAVNMVMDGTIADSKTQILILKTARLLNV